MLSEFLQALSHNLSRDIRDAEKLGEQRDSVKGMKSLMETHRFDDVVKHLRAAQLKVNNILTSYASASAAEDMDVKSRIAAAKSYHLADMNAMERVMTKAHNPRFSATKYAPHTKDYLPAEVREYVMEMEQDLNRIVQCVAQCKLMLDQFNLQLPSPDNYDIKDAKDRLVEAQRILSEIDIYSIIR